MREEQRVTLDVRAFREGSRLDPSLAVMTTKQEILEKLEDVVGLISDGIYGASWAITWLRLETISIGAAVGLIIVWL